MSQIDSPSALQRYDSEALEIGQALIALEVKDEDSYALAADSLREVKTILKNIEAERTQITKPQRDALDATNALFKRIAEKYLAHEMLLKEKMAAFQEIERAKEQKLLAEYAESGSRSTLALATQGAPTAEKIQTRTAYDWKIVDATKVPKDYWIIDQQKLGAVVRASKGSVSIPGVEIKSRIVIAAGTK